MKVSVQCKEKVGEREDTSSEGPLPISSAPMDLILQVVGRDWMQVLVQEF